MSKQPRRVALYVTLTLVLVFLLLRGMGTLDFLTRFRSGSPYMDYPSLIPSIERIVSVRFDPSYYYTGERPQQLAERLATQWSEAGINLVFYRTYDPRYGAFYKTGYEFNVMGEFGQYDLLRYLLRECHERGIRVVGWLPVLNHGGAWTYNPGWRSQTAAGADYTATGLEFPLCARNPDVRSWWRGYLNDFLDNYREIDGVDFGEPVVSWSKGDACFCTHCEEAVKESGDEGLRAELRARALTELVTDSISLVHEAGKLACLTSVQPALPTGELRSPAELMEMTGLDLPGVANADGEKAPDILCPEFIWQQEKSLYRGEPASEEVFTPAWTRSAVESFLGWLEKPANVVAHVEITDFPGVEVDAKALKDSLTAAIEGGAHGIDVYDSHQLDEKNAWTALSELKDTVKTKRCLVLYDDADGESDAVQTGEMLRHFRVEVTLQLLADYTPGILNEYDNVFYVGTTADAHIPAAFLSDLRDIKSTVCWLGFNIDTALADDRISKSLGMEYVGTEEGMYRAVQYNGINLHKTDPWINVVSVTDEKTCIVMATAGDGEQTVPYALRSGDRFWYFADVPTSFALEGGRYLVFADLLHDILNEDHEERHLAMVRIEDVHPLTDPTALRRIAHFLHSKGVPFQIALVPVYVFPDENVYVRISDQPEFVSTIKHMVRRGGTVVMHGYTHQRFSESTTDYEFWDPISDGPPEGENEGTIRNRIESGLQECWSVGIYPLMWETPHYAGSQMLYSVVKDHFSIAMERRQSVDRTGTDQLFPYLIMSDRYGQMIVPENLGFIPLENQDADVVVEPARNMKAVRDGVASFFFHASIDIDVLKDIVRAFKAEDYVFTAIGDLPVEVKTSFGTVTNRSGTIDIETESGAGKERTLLFPGIHRSVDKVTVAPEEGFHKEVTLSKGEMYAVSFTSEDELFGEVVNEKEWSRAAATEILRRVSNYRGERCSAPIPLVIEDTVADEDARAETEIFKKLLELMGIDFEQQDMRRFSIIPANVNLVVVPSAVAGALSDSQSSTILEAVSDRGVSLITSGSSSLADELAIEKLDRRILVKQVRDVFYTDMEILWEPAVEATCFESPAEAVYIYKDADTDTPLVIGSPLGKGRYIFLGTSVDDGTPYGSTRYPYLMTHVFRYFGLFPLVRAANIETYFNPGDREDVAVEDLVKFWRRSGVRTIYAAAWQVFPEWTYDYERLIRLAHTNAMRVYAWFELPYLNEVFWMDHPEWRDRNALGEDAVVEWRKALALTDESCRDAVESEMRGMLEKFDWDGVLLNRVGLESDDGPRSPETYTPFHESARNMFETDYGYDPVDLFNETSPRFWKTNHKALDQFEEFRTDQGLSHLDSVLSMLAESKDKGRDHWEIVVTHDATRLNSGISLEQIDGFKEKFGITVQIVSPEESRWEVPEQNVDLVRLDVSPTTKFAAFHPAAPTRYPTGLALYALMSEFITTGQRFSLNSESSIYEIDMQMLPFVLASASREEWTPEGLTVTMPKSAEMVFAKSGLKNLTIDGEPAGSVSQNRLIVPVGEHRIAVSNRLAGVRSILKSNTRLAACSADIMNTRVLARGISVSYDAGRRVLLVVNEEPRTVYVDGRQIDFTTEKGLLGWVLALPSGAHTATIITRGLAEFMVNSASIVLSNTIIAISLCAVSALVFMFVATHVRHKRRG